MVPVDQGGHAVPDSPESGNKSNGNPLRAVDERVAGKEWDLDGVLPEGDCPEVAAKHEATLTGALRKLLQFPDQLGISF